MTETQPYTDTHAPARKKKYQYATRLDVVNEFCSLGRV